MKSHINLVVALKAEAQPLIEHFGLHETQSTDQLFPVFEGDATRLVISGIGKQRVSAAVGWLKQSLPSDERSAWLNVGIAGHRHLAVGEGFMANCVKDAETGETWYPSFVSDFNVQTGLLITVDEVELEYPDAAGYDMEGFGFFSSVGKQVPLELVHSYKIVSDNRSSCVSRLTGKMVADLVGRHLNPVDSIHRQLSVIASSLVWRSEYAKNQVEPFAQRWRLSVTQRVLLGRMLQKARTLDCEITVNSAVVADCADASALLKTVETHLHRHWERTEVGICTSTST